MSQEPRTRREERVMPRLRRFFDVFDSAFLPTLKRRQTENPLYLLEDLIQARVCVLFLVLFGLMLLCSMLILHFKSGAMETSHVVITGMWLIILLVIVPATMRRATSSRLHSYVLGTLMNVTPWATMAQKTSGFRLSCASSIAGPTATMFLLGPKAGLLSAVNNLGVVVTKMVMEQHGMQFDVYDAATTDMLFLMSAVISVLFVLMIGFCHNYIREERLREMESLNKKWEAAAKVAEEVSDTKTRFLANMSHEIRTPLNGIIGMTEILAQSKLSPTQRKELHIISQCGHGLLSIVTDILDFSKIIANKVEIEKVQFSVEEVFARCFDTMAMRGHMKMLQLSHDLSGILQHARWIGDPTRIQQVVLNLLSNAVKFTPEFGEVTLRAFTQRKHLENPLIQKLTVEVIDTGPGVPPDRLNHIWSPFSQADVSTTRVHGGTGLGLAIARSLVNMMDGSIAVASSAQGAVFRFDVELALVSEPPVRAVSRPEAKPTIGQVLLIDTYLKQMGAISSMLESLGATRILTSSVEDAPTVLKENQEICAIIVNIATYQADQDRWREEFLIKHVFAESVWEFRIDQPPRIILLRNVLGNATPQLDAFLQQRDVSRRVRVTQIDNDTILAEPRKRLAPEGRRLRMWEPSIVDENYASADHYISSGSLEDELVEVVCLTKPVRLRHLQWALVAPLDHLVARAPDHSDDGRSDNRSDASAVDRDALGVRGPEADRGSHDSPLPSSADGSHDRERISPQAGLGLRGREASGGTDRSSPRMSLQERGREPSAGTDGSSPHSGLIEHLERSRDVPSLPSSGQYDSTSPASPTQPTTPRDDQLLVNPAVTHDFETPALPRTGSTATLQQSGSTATLQGSQSTTTLAASGGSFATLSGSRASNATLPASGSQVALSSSQAEPLVESDSGLSAVTPVIPSLSVFSATDFRPQTKLSVLVVDDNSVNVNVACKLLNILGHQSDVAVNGAEAIAKYAAHLEAARKGDVFNAFVAFLDLHMPVCSGEQAAQEMRRLAREYIPRNAGDRPRLYIVAVTADALESTRQACLDTFFDDFLSKPFHLARLKQVTRQAAETIFL